MSARAWLVRFVVGGLAFAGSPELRAAPPLAEPAEPAESDEPGARGRLEGRVRVAGRRSPLAEAKLMVLVAPDDAEPGRRARVPIDPDLVTWVREAQTDEEGRFVFEDLPVGKVRIVVLAPGFARSEVFAEVGSEAAEPLELFVEPSEGSTFRTEVVSDRHVEDAEPEHRITPEQARVYAGSGGDPLRAAQNLPGVARSPGGLGMIAIRGGDPRQTGVYLDGHPIPRGFHVLPIASVVSPGMVESVELTPGNYDAAFGGHAAGLLQIRTRSGPLAGVEDRAIHGEAHLDLFDFGGMIAGPVGPGAITFGFRRAHVGAVIGVTNRFTGLDILVPNYWDYLGRFDMPVAKHHLLTLRVLGAGDRLQSAAHSDSFAGFSPSFDFSAGFHRIDVAHAFESGRWRTSLGAALRLDSGHLEAFYRTTERRAWVGSLRASASYDLSRRATLIAGLDLVSERWRRFEVASVSSFAPDVPDETTRTRGSKLALGTWLGVALHRDLRTGPAILRMQVRLNVFSEGHETRVMPDPRVDLRVRVHPRVELLAAIGQYSFSKLVQAKDAANLFNPQTRIPGRNGVIDIPIWLLSYFDPGLEGEVEAGSLLLGRTLQASAGVRVDLPWQLGLRGTTFYRAQGAQTRSSVHGYLSAIPQTRAYGLELLLDRALARDIHGWIGYTLLRSETRSEGEGKWLPADFDQRHNLVALVSFGLPHGFRLGVRFRLVSGNPDRPIYGKIVAHDNFFGVSYTPIRGEIGSEYRPVFHQLDLRLDKTWTAKRASVGVYLDIQNVYNNLYPELWSYTADYRERSAGYGLPIFPSLGVRVDY